jgi:hypothetical protein
MARRCVIFRPTTVSSRRAALDDWVVAIIGDFHHPFGWLGFLKNYLLIFSEQLLFLMLDCRPSRD